MHDTYLTCCSCCLPDRVVRQVAAVVAVVASHICSSQKSSLGHKRKTLLAEGKIYLPQ